MNIKKLAVLVLVLSLTIPAMVVQADADDEWADLAIDIYRVDSGTSSGGAAINTTWDDGDNGNDATGPSNWPPSSPSAITTVGIDQKSTLDTSDDERGWVILAFTDNVCLDGTGADLHIYDAFGGQSVIGNESADIDIAIGTGSFAAAGSVSPGLGYALNVSGALTYFTRVRVTATDFAGQLTLAGLDLDAVECLNSVNISDISLAAEPASDVNPVGSEHTVTATLTPVIEGVEVMFTITGPSSAESGTADTDEFGAATFAYTGAVAGTDSIEASVTFEGTTITADSVTKHWVDRYVTGGGNYKVKNTSHWTFGGTVGLNDSSGLVGNFQVQDHTNKVKWHFNQINWLFFPDGQTAMFEAETSDGAKAIFTIVDDGEPGKDVDMIGIDFDAGPDLDKELITGGNFQVRPGPVPGVVTLSIGEGWDACGQGGSGTVTLAPFSGGLGVVLEMTGLPVNTSYDFYLTDFTSHPAFGALPAVGAAATFTRTDCTTSIVGTGTRTAFLLDGDLDSSNDGKVSVPYTVNGVTADSYELQLAITLDGQGRAQFRTGDTYGDTVTVVIP